MWRSALARCLVWFVALAGLGLFATAQESVGNIYGHAVDEHGDADPGRDRDADRRPAPRSTTVTRRRRPLPVPLGSTRPLHGRRHDAGLHDRHARERRRHPRPQHRRGHRAEALGGRRSRSPSRARRRCSTRVRPRPARRSPTQELEEHPDHPRHLRHDAAGAGHPDSTSANMAGIHTADVGGPGLHQQGLRRSPRTSSTASRSPTTPTATSTAGRTAASPLYFDFETFDERRDRDRRLAPRPADARRHDQRRDQEAAPTSSRARPATSTRRPTGSRATCSAEAKSRGLPDRPDPVRAGLRRRGRRPDRPGPGLDLGRRLASGLRPHLHGIRLVRATR